MAHSKAKF